MVGVKGKWLRSWAMYSSDRSLSRIIIFSFVSSHFLSLRNPNSPEPVPVEWPHFTLANEEYLHLEAAGTAARRHYRARETAFWLDYVPKIKKNKCKGQDVTNESAVTSYSLNMRLMMSIGYLVMYYNKFL